MENDPTINAVALDMAIRNSPGKWDDEIVSCAVKFRHFLMTGQALIPPQPEQPE